MGLIGFLIAWPIFIDWYFDEKQPSKRSTEPAEIDKDELLDNALHPIAIMWWLAILGFITLGLQYLWLIGQP